MITGIKVTLYGFYKEYPNLFNGLELPADMSVPVLIDLIMERSGELFPYHQQPDFLQKNISHWSTVNQENWLRMYSALSAEYNPINNYDRIEESTETPNVSFTKTGGHTETPDISNVMSGGRTMSTDTTTDGNVENLTSAYNEATYSPEAMTDNFSHVEGADTLTYNGETSKTSGSNTFTYNNEETTETGTRKHESHVHGNIGVTTSQQMIQSELELRKFNLYDYIAKQFEERFLIQVY